MSSKHHKSTKSTKSNTKTSGKKRKFKDLKDNDTKNAKDNIDDVLPPSKFFKPAPLDEHISFRCPYLDQIDRKTLDFDFEKVCSVTMSNHNVYGCLVCGHYFAGRSKGSAAYFHALQENHRIFIHLDNGKIYCLPDDYQVIDASLSDIKHNLHPKFSKQDVYNLDNKVEYSHALNERDYLPGVIGLNNLNNTDWLNVVIQSLMRVKPLRNYFINPSNYANNIKTTNNNSVLAVRFGELVRKYFNSRNFKGQVSPHELLQAISLESNKKFQIGKRSDPLAFLGWFLNQLHKDLGGNKKHSSSIVSRTFQGLITVTVHTPKKANKKHLKNQPKTQGDDANNNNNNKEILALSEDDNDGDHDMGDGDGDDEFDITEENVPFFYLLLNLPTMPLFKDMEQAKFIPQIPLPELFNKFNGYLEETLPNGVKKQYKLARLPPYLLTGYRRFHENNFMVAKNSTIVGFVLKGLDLKPYLFPPECDKNALLKWNIKKLKSKLGKLGVSKKEIGNIVEKNELIEQIIKHFPGKKRWKTKYDLVSQICHDGEYDTGVNKSFIHHSPNNMWYEMQDLHVQERMPQLVAISEAYIQTWVRKETK